VWAEAVKTARPDPAGSLPHGALLYLRAKGLQGLLNDCNTSRGRRDCLKEADQEAFSRWCLFGRLSQPQIKFSIAQRSLTTRIYLPQATDSDHLFFNSCITGQPSITFSSTSLTSRWIAAREASLHGRSRSSRCIRWPDYIVLAGIVTVVIGG
jgi:hypothetical protein